MVDLPGQFTAPILIADPFIVLFELVVIRLQPGQLLLKILLSLTVRLAPMFLCPLVSGFSGHTSCFADLANVNIRRKPLFLEQLSGSNQDRNLFRRQFFGHGHLLWLGPEDTALCCLPGLKQD